MRKGKLITERAKTIKPGDVYLDKGVKLMVTVGSVENGIVKGETSIGQPCKTDAKSLVILTIFDQKEEVSFDLDHSQQEYLYKNYREHDYNFFVKKDPLNNYKPYAVVFTKDVKMIDHINHMSPIADAYGMYVASQKAIGEPAKKFEDWYFDVSV